MEKSRYYDLYHSAIGHAQMCAPCKVKIMQDLNRRSLAWERGRISDDEFRSYLEWFCRKYDVRLPGGRKLPRGWSFDAGDLENW